MLGGGEKQSAYFAKNKLTQAPNKNSDFFLKKCKYK